tara:strand:+ start:658 stop:939 length:282 start_codon:yes stop_codon:yes gene_type:complete
MKRKIKRAVTNRKEKEAKKRLQEKVNLFSRAPDHCLTCNKPFDKKDKEQAMTWYVVVRQEEKKVNLYCPKCWNAALDVINNFHDDYYKEDPNE